MDSKQKKILKDLHSPIEKDVLNALEALKHDGHPEMIAPIMQLVSDRKESEQSANKAVEILGTLKDSKAQEKFLSELKEEKYVDTLPELLPAVWMAGIKAENHISGLVKQALKSDFQSVFEVITIIENSENQIPEPEIIESQIACKLYLEKNDKSEKKEIVENLLSLLNQIDSYD